MSLAHFAQPAGAFAQRYRDADLDQRIAAATPHELVAMLYAGACTALRAGEGATRGGDAAARMASATRALRILDGLDGSLDHARGVATARLLAAAYAQVRAVVVAANSERRADLFAAAENQLAELAAAWSAIGTRPRIAA